MSTHLQRDTLGRLHIVLVCCQINCSALDEHSTIVPCSGYPHCRRSSQQNLAGYLSLVGVATTAANLVVKSCPSKRSIHSPAILFIHCAQVESLSAVLYRRRHPYKSTGLSLPACRQGFWYGHPCEEVPAPIRTSSAVLVCCPFPDQISKPFSGLWNESVNPRPHPMLSAQLKADVFF